MKPFDACGELPWQTTAVLEASAGTGKTWTVGALVTRYVAEGRATLDQMLVITFGRAASQELRERVRAALVETERALADPAAARADEDNSVIALLAQGSAEEVALRRSRLRDALAAFDGATIATTHQFCQQVLRSLGVAGDTDTGAELVDSLDDLVEEVVDDLYLQRFGNETAAPPFNRDLALRLAKAAVGDPQAALAPLDADPGTRAAARVDFATAVRAEVDRRKRRLGLLSYDDLLSRLATALDKPDSAASERMRARWKVVLVDEFQDTDPVQWQVLARAFTGHATLVLIGDPKQAIYAFRGGDIVSYLEAAQTAGDRHTLARNHRSDGPLVSALQALLGGAALGDERIVVHPVEAAHTEPRLLGAPSSAPVRVRRVPAEDFSLGKSGTAQIGQLRQHIAQDLANDVARLLTSGATYDGRPVGAGDVAILMYSLGHAQLFRDQLAHRGIPSVVSGGSSVLVSEAGDHWLALLEALEQPQRSGRVRALALTPFIGMDAQQLDSGGDDLTDQIAERVRFWLDLFRLRGIAAVHECLVTDGLLARALSRPDGERLVTDLTHLAQVLHEVAHRERFGLAALLEWLRDERRSAARSNERTRRLDTDATAVQLVTIHASKGLQYPVVYLPLAFDKWIPDDEPTLLFHDTQGRRTLDVGGGRGNLPAAQTEAAGEELRLTYVALTRAQSQVVVWVAPSYNACHGGITRLLLGRAAGQATVPTSTTRGAQDGEVITALAAWEQSGALSVEDSRLQEASAVAPAESLGALTARSFARGVDTEWRRTSYSGLIRAEDQQSVAGVDSEPEIEGTVDETAAEDDELAAAQQPDAVPTEDDLPSPMNGLPAGATFGSLVHGVLEHADPQADDLLGELRARVVEQLRWWSVEATPDALAEALVPMQHTSLGPLADGRTLHQIPARDRLCELDFEFPLTGGDLPDRPTEEVLLAALAGVLRRHLAADDPMRRYADRLEAPSLGGQALRGYLSGSIDVVLRVPDDEVGHRFVVVDYKTNALGELGRPLTALDYTPAAMTEAMLHSHYPLQALLYSVVLHRYLSWRLPGYRPEAHLGGILYLYVRGMCGPETPEIDGIPCGVFTWHPPAAMVVELSELLAGRITGSTARTTGGAA